MTIVLVVRTSQHNQVTDEITESTHTHTSPKTRTDNIDPFLSAHAFRLSTNSQTDVCELFSHFQLSFNYRNGDLDHHLVPSNEERKARKVIEYRIEVSD